MLTTMFVSCLLFASAHKQTVYSLPVLLLNNMPIALQGRSFSKLIQSTGQEVNLLCTAFPYLTSAEVGLRQYLIYMILKNWNLSLSSNAKPKQ